MAEAGQKGTSVRSDCWIELTPGGSGLRIDVKSKVNAMYGESINAQLRGSLESLGIRDAAVRIEDAGALPLTIAARLETAVRRAGLPVSKPLLPEAASAAVPKTTRDRLRRSRLYLPGNEPKFMVNAGLHGPDAVILDLEDSVAPSEKDAARAVVRNALVALDFGEAERMVRINQIPAGLEDLDWIVPYGVHVVLIPKCESAEQVRAVSERIAKLGPPGPVYLMPIIESALGCFRAYEIASAVPEVVALTIGLEDYTADIGAQRTPEAKESFWARSIVVNAARAAGVQAIDTVFSDVDDMEGLRQSVLEAKGLGFEGKGCIHPRQIPVVHEALAPDAAAVTRATAIVRAFEEAEKKGLAVVSLGSKMIDPPVVKRALGTVKLALMTGRLAADWRERMVEAKKPAKAASAGGGGE
jgi:citrate lyase subunit beta / citryl-CoA lyase